MPTAGDTPLEDRSFEQHASLFGRNLGGENRDNLAERILVESAVLKTEPTASRENEVLADTFRHNAIYSGCGEQSVQPTDHENALVSQSDGKVARRVWK